MLNNEKINKIIQAKIAFLQTNVRKNLIAKKNWFRFVASRTFKTIIIELFFVLTKNVNALLTTNLIDVYLTNNNVNKTLINNNTNNKKIKIEIVSLKVKKLKFEKMKFYFNKLKKNIFINFKILFFK